MLVLSNEVVLRNMCNYPLRDDLLRAGLLSNNAEKTRGSVLTVAYSGEINGKRQRGRKRKSWLGNIEETTTRRINECCEVALDREEWRRTIASNLWQETEQRPVLPKPSTPLEKVLPREIAYADDVDFVAFQDIDIEEVGKVLEKYNLQVNVDKTEFTNLSRGETNWQTTKKVVTLIGDQEDIERRKQLSSAALVKLKNVWLKGDKITKNTKLKLYKALVKSVLTYNCGTWAPTQSQEERLNAFHRKQLKKVLNIKYPVKITNSSLYNKCNERTLSIFILESRWRLFGHILRRDSQIPANQAMSGYFVTEGSKFKGRPLTTLPVVLNRDLSRIINSNLHLKSSHDLEHLRSMAQQRDEWTKLTARIREAAEASQLEH
ncbi:hypothetical protein ElyMa_006766300 [Elysia marginata]|uniref:Reverse transcriptase domain-containing protein n=1 Tax=Elysia marginata TaxID=1093978 RepID=A0AAV4IYL4_9GAST|nr:hypothetical protein ElyMa_006766300 [Elysia marginata]